MSGSRAIASRRDWPLPWQPRLTSRRRLGRSGRRGRRGLPRRARRRDAGAALAAKATIAADVRTVLPIVLGAPGSAPAQDDPVGAFADVDSRLRLCRATGAGAADLDGHVGSMPAAGPGLEGLKQATQARYEPTTWLQVARRLNDPLRMTRRDALVAYWKHLKGATTDEQLFSELLIDAGRTRWSSRRAWHMPSTRRSSSSRDPPGTVEPTRPTRGGEG